MQNNNNKESNHPSKIIAMTLPVLPSNQTSVRYQRLLECIPIALDKCHGKIDVEHAIQICYGSSSTTTSNKNDSTASTSDNDIFCTMLRDNILQQQFHTEVINDVVTYLQNQNVQEKLYRLETIIKKVDSDISKKENEDRKDKASTLMALQKSKSGGKISPTDILQYQSYQHLLKKKGQIQQDIERLEQTIQSMQDQLRLEHRGSDENIQNLKTMQVELEQSADLCSMIR